MTTTPHRLLYAEPDACRDAYPCTTAWHLSGMPLRLYTFACRISEKKASYFFASLSKVAQYLHTDRTTVARAAKALVELGFFEVVSANPGMPTFYKVVSHAEWAKDHPSQCATLPSAPFAKVIPIDMREAI